MLMPVDVRSVSDILEIAGNWNVIQGYIQESVLSHARDAANHSQRKSIWLGMRCHMLAQNLIRVVCAAKHSRGKITLIDTLKKLTVVLNILAYSFTIFIRLSLIMNNFFSCAKTDGTEVYNVHFADLLYLIISKFTSNVVLNTKHTIFLCSRRPNLFTSPVPKMEIHYIKLTDRLIHLKEQSMKEI